MKRRRLVTPRDKIVKQLDDIVRTKTLARDGYRCVLCGRTDHLQCGHLFSRVSYTTRWDARNVFCQCEGCNMRHENNPHIFTLWFIKQFGTRVYEALMVRAKRASRLTTPELEALRDALEAEDWGRPMYEPTPAIQALAQHKGRSQ